MEYWLVCADIAIDIWRRYIMKRTIGIIMVLLMLMSVTGAWADNAKDTQTGSEKVKVIIGFVDTPDKGDENMIRGHGGKTKYTYHIINAKAVEISEQSIAHIKNNPRVAYVEEDAKVYALDAELDNSWGVKHIGAGVVHEYNKGAGVNVSIIDTGIDTTHPDLYANYKGGYDYVNNDADPKDDNGHGTHCAGIVAAEDNGIGVVGVAPGANLYAVKVLNRVGSGYISDVIAGIDWSVNNDMDVVSMSLGSSTSSTSLKTACDDAYEAGLVVVAAAGNSGDGNSNTTELSYPAAYDSVIAVGATDRYDTAPSWSNSGPYLELAAPGAGIYSTLPTYRVTLTRTYGYNYGTLSGTSMACPHVAGTAALVLFSDPTLTNEDVRLRLNTTADNLGPEGWDSVYGNGLVDADEAATGDLVPVVNIVNPMADFTVSGTIEIEASASDDVGVTQVDFYIDDVWLGNGTVVPYTASWDTETVLDGLHIVTATATDTAGQTASDTITVTVDNIDELPTVEITTPVDGVTVSGIITIEANASDDVGVTKVDFYINDTLLATDDTEPYNTSWNTTTVADGSHIITATATDTAGQTASDMNGVTVDNTPPDQVTNLIVTTISSSKLDLSWSAITEMNLDHYNVYRNTTSGGPYNLVASPTTNSYSDTGLEASTTYYYTVTAVDTAGNEGTASDEANGTTDEASAVQDFANQDIPVSGTVSEDYTYTHDSDNTSESITEVSTRGRPSSRYSYLEHRWTIDVAGGTKVTFNVEAYHNANTENDHFEFAYSTDGSTYTDMLTVTKTEDDDTLQTCELSETLSGTVYIRVVDTDQTGGRTALDAIYIDQMYIECVP
jgi:subtilisin/minor extracellular protease Epr